MATHLTKDDFDNWWNSPVGIEFKGLLREDMDKLAHGSMTTEHATSTVEKAEAVGAYKVLQTYLGMDYKFFSGN